MRAQLKSIFVIILLLLSFDTLAAKSSKLTGKNPVVWTLSSPFLNPAITGRNDTVIYTFTSQLPFQMVKPLVIEKSATPASDFIYADACTGVKLSPNQSCTVAITLTPSSAGNRSIQLTIAGYDNNRVLVPALSTVATGQAVANVYGTVTQPMTSKGFVGAANSYNFTFTNSTSTDISNVSVNVTQTSGTPAFTTTCTSTLHQTCTITGTYTPTSSSPNVQTVSAVMTYGSGSTASVSTSTDVASATGVIASFVGNNYLPAVMVGAPTPTYTLWFIYTNSGPGSVTMNANATPVTTTAGGNLTPVFNHCANTPLAVGNQCDVQYTFTADPVISPATNLITVTGSVSYKNGIPPSGPDLNSSIATQTTVYSSLSTSRTLKFENKCGFTVWFSLNGASFGATPKTCTTDADCAPSANCSSQTTPNTCFWKNYTPVSNAPGGTTLLELPTNTSNTVTIPLNAGADPTIQWSGNFSASLGCDPTHPATACKQAACGNAGGTTSCTSGKDFSQPATQAEITMLIAGADTYDVETINGFHIPVSMQPDSTVQPDNYTCGNAGNFTAANNFGACNWTTAVPPGDGYYMTDGSGAACTLSTPHSLPSTGTCTLGLQCGLDLTLTPKCGKFLGYWSADQVCSMNTLTPAASAFFNCTTPLPPLSATVPFPAGSTLYNLMSCAVPAHDTNSTFNSCYLPYSGTPPNNQLPCCGCIDWWTVPGIGANSNSNTTSCTQTGQSTPQTDPVWNTYIQGTVEWMKKACPSAYVYPFDDKSSTFTCTNTLPAQPNSVGYTITFCPGGDSGQPTGVDEGRT